MTQPESAPGVRTAPDVGTHAGLGGRHLSIPRARRAVYRRPMTSQITRSLRAALALPGIAFFQCSSASVPVSQLSADAGADAAYCYPDNDGINGGDYTIDLVVNDTGFFASGPDAGMKDLLSTQNDAQVTLTLTNKGTRPHGFKVGCTTAEAPAGCPTTVCFPATSTIAPLEPGETKVITFDTPTPDGIIYQFSSNEPADSSVRALNDGQWSLM